MAGGFPYSPGLCGGSNTVPLNSSGTSITSSATANAKGAWTMIGVTGNGFQSPRDACALFVGMNNANAQTQRFAIDIGAGAAGSQVVLINNLAGVSFATGGVFTCSYIFLPMNLPSGTTLWARSQSSSTSQIMFVSAITFDGDFVVSSGFSGVDCLGFVSGTTTGTTITSSASANNKGTYTQIVAATARDYDAFAIWGYLSGSTGTAILLDVAIGAAGTERVILPNVYLEGNGPKSTPGGMDFIPLRIPAGTRIAARSQSSTASLTLPLLVYGAYK